MTTDSFASINREVTQIAEDRAIGKTQAFTEWALAVYHDIDIDDVDDQAESLTEIDGVDGWHRDTSSRTLCLWRCGWTDNASKVYDDSLGLELIDAFRSICRPTDVVDAITSRLTKTLSSIVKTVNDHGWDVRLIVAVPTRFGNDVEAGLTSTLRSTFDAGDMKIDLVLVSADRLVQRVETADLAGTSVEFRLRGDAHTPPTVPDFWKAAVVSLDGESVAKIAEQYKHRLFHLNVRFALSHLQERIKKIRTQLESPEAAQYFWVYNNGLTILCDEFKLQEGAVTILNPQVVNGCQTVNALRAKYPRFGDAAAVLARIIKLPADSQEREAEALSISRWTNSQVPVLARDLHANDTVQKTIQKSFRDLSPSWFYETKRGEWEAMSQQKKNEYDFRVGMDMVGQCYRMLDEPAEALAKKKDLFDDEEVYSRVFNRDRSAEEYLFPYLCRNYYWNFWNAKRFDAIRRGSVKNFTDAQLRRLMRAKGQVVSHSVALTRLLFQEGDEWAPDDAAFAFNVFCLAKIDEPKLDRWNRHVGIAFYYFLVALDEANEGKESRGENPITLKKKLEEGNHKALEALWTKISNDASLVVGPEWREGLVDDIMKRFELER